MSLAPIGPEMVENNIRIVAARLGWPDGVDQAVIDLITEYPAWVVTWCQSEYGPRRIPGFYAWPDYDYSKTRTVYAKDPAALREVLELCPNYDRWSTWVPPGGWLPLR